MIAAKMRWVAVLGVRLRTQPPMCIDIDSIESVPNPHLLQLYLYDNIITILPD
jgi:hypothetical protein